MVEEVIVFEGLEVGVGGPVAVGVEAWVTRPVGVPVRVLVCVGV